MSKNTTPKLGQFVKTPAVLQNHRPDRPKLKPIERELCAIIHSWTAEGRGRYNYQSGKELARLLGSSDKTVADALHRLRALGLIDWYCFPHGIGVKHLRFGTTNQLQRWASSVEISEPTPAQLAKARQFTSKEKLRAYVCEKPKTVGFEVWRACCNYCGFEADKPKAPAKFEQPTPAHTTTDVMHAAAALPYNTAEFAQAWEDWKAFRRSKGNALTGKAEEIALTQLQRAAENEAEAIDSIHAAIAGGYMSIRPDITRAKTGGTMPEVPINAWDWVKRKAKERRRQPADLDELVGWLTEFRQAHPGAPAYVVWSKARRSWEIPGFMTKIPNDIPGKFHQAFEAYEKLRRGQDDETPYESVHEFAENYMHRARQPEATDKSEAQARWEEKRDADDKMRGKFENALSEAGWIEEKQFSEEMQEIYSEVAKTVPYDTHHAELIAVYNEQREEREDWLRRYNGEQRIAERAAPHIVWRCWPGDPLPSERMHA